MSRATSLLELVQGLLERTYRMRTGVRDIGRFVIGHRGYRRLYVTMESAGAADGCAARTLFRETRDGMRACIFYPDEQIRRLESHPPQRGMNDRNVDPFATLVEELDHLLFIAERARAGGELTLFELELHANVSKHLVLSRFTAGSSGTLTEEQRLWLRHHLFNKIVYSDRDRATRQRYRDAAHWAVRLIDALQQQAVPDRLNCLRRFHEAGTRGKVELIGSIG